MKKRRLFKLLLASFLLLIFSSPLQADEFSDFKKYSKNSQTFTRSLIKTTGVSMSPILGVTIYGAWTYFKTAPENRAKLPLYNQPVCWVPLFIILACLFMKSTIGEALPLVKKPLDVAGEFVKTGGALAALPVVAGIFANTALPETTAAVESVQHFIFPTACAAEAVTANPGILTTISWGLGFIAGAIIFALVFCGWHIIDILILICPFPAVDALLSGFRLSVVGALAAVSAINIYLGLAMALAILIVSILVCRWSFRFTLFGWIFAWDTLAGIINKSDRPALPIRAFATKKLKKHCPARSYGTIARTQNGEYVFSWKKWFIIRKAIKLPADCQLKAGMLYPSVISGENSLLILRPKYKKLHPETARALLMPRHNGENIDQTPRGVFAKIKASV